MLVVIVATVLAVPIVVLLRVTMVVVKIHRAVCVAVKVVRVRVEMRTLDMVKVLVVDTVTEVSVMVSCTIRVN